MKRVTLPLQPGDSFVVGAGIEGVAVLRKGRVVGQNAQYNKPLKIQLPEALAQRETRDNYSKYLTLIDKKIGVLDPFQDHQKDLKPKGLDNLKVALNLCNEALTYGQEKDSSPLKSQNLRLGIYNRKALIEFNLNPDDASVAIATVNQGLKEATSFNLVKEDYTNQELDIFANYQQNLSKQRELYMAVIDVEQLIALATKSFTDDDKQRAKDSLEEALFQRGDIRDRDLSFKSVLQLLNKLVEFSLKEKFYTEAQSYIEFGLDIITRLKPDSKSVQEEDNFDLESFARSISQAYGNDRSDQAISHLQKLKDKFHSNMTLTKLAQESFDKVNDPGFQLAKVDRLKRQGNLAEAALLAIDQAPRFLDQVNSSQAALNLWLEKAHGEFKLLMPEELVKSLKTVIDAGFIGVDKGEANLEDRVKRNYLLFAAGSYQLVLDNARNFIKETDSSKNEFKDLREHSFWLEIRSLQARNIGIGNQLQTQIGEEFPDSHLLNSLMN